MDRLRPETLTEIGKKQRAYPHEVRAMVEEIIALRAGMPVVEEKPVFVPKEAMQVVGEYFVLGIKKSTINGGNAKTPAIDHMRAMRVGATDYVATVGGMRFVVWRLL